MRPFFPFYGGKWRAAKLYPPPAGLVVEPFAGSAGYSVYHDVPRVVLIERDEQIAAVWRYLIAASPAELAALPDIRAGQSVNDLDVCQSARWLIGFWINVASARPRLTPSMWVRHALAGRAWPTGGSQLVWGARVRARLAEQVPRIRRWRLIEGDYTEAPDAVATWFVDPPYEGAAGDGYHHHDIDRAHLARWSRARRGLRIVCEAVGACWLPFEALATVKATAGRRRRGVSAEAVWTHGRAA